MRKKLYITTAIPYINGQPHIGTTLGYLIADIWSRYQKQNNFEVRYQIGTDEHGNKNAQKADELNMSPQEYADKAHLFFKAIADNMDVQYTDFIRTTDKEHIKAVQAIWIALKPYIYKDNYEGWNCTGCEQFYTDKEVKETSGVCANHQKPYERLKEQNYYLKCSQFTDRIKEALDNGRMKIVPEFRKNEILELLKDGARDVSISRPKKNLTWGVPVPGDPDQVMYVWLDALTNYITVLGYPEKNDWKEYWPADVQIVGKDILRFHAIIWPSILLGLGLTLPKKILAHGFIKVGGNKISKSLGNIIDPNQIIKEYGLDAFRYYFARYIPTQDDGDFTWERFESIVNNDLSNELGNLVNRVEVMITKYQEGVIGNVNAGEHDVLRYHEAMRDLKFNLALDEVWLIIRSLNQYLDEVKPWKVASLRDSDTEASGHLNEILVHAVGTLRQVADLLLPIIPSTANKIKETLGGEVVKKSELLFPKVYIRTKNNLENNSKTDQDKNVGMNNQTTENNKS